MSDIFRIHVLPAQRGDALWIEYGPEAAPRHILIDGGIKATGKVHLRNMLANFGTPLHIELLVVTHVDLDHILGVIELLKDLPPGVTFGDIWFNSWDQLKADGLEPMGIKEGIDLSEMLEQHHAGTWNKASGGRAIALGANDAVVRYPLKGDMEITVLAPGRAQLQKLREDWHEVVEAFGAAEEAEACGEEPMEPEIPGLEVMGAIDVPTLAKSAFSEDNTVPNGSSIALMLEFGGRRALMLGDAYPSVVAKSLRSLAPNGRFHAEVVKLAHHGSRNNTDRSLASMLDAPTWIFSSNGANNTKHPHREAVARVLYDGAGVKTLVFNYRTGFNDAWDDGDLKDDYNNYDVVYGDGEAPVVVRILPPAQTDPA